MKSSGTLFSRPVMAGRRPPTLAAMLAATGVVLCAAGLMEPLPALVGLPAASAQARVSASPDAAGAARPVGLLASPPGVDPQDGLTRIASGQVQVGGAASCPCPMAELPRHGSGSADSDDRISAALGFAYRAPPTAPFRWQQHWRDPDRQPDREGMRWALVEMASAQRGDWMRECPCPMFEIHTEGGWDRK